MILHKEKANLGLTRADFSSPFSAFVFGNYIYNSKKLVDLLDYDTSNDIYYYADNNVNIYSPTTPTLIGSLFLDIKPILFCNIANIDFFISSNNIPNDFISFRMVVKSTKDIFSGFLITPEHYRYIMEQMTNNIKQRITWFHRIHPDLLSDDIVTLYWTCLVENSSQVY